MRIYADVYDAAGNRLGPGPLASLRAASVTRALDGIGAISLSLSPTDDRGLALLQNKRRLRIYVEHDDVTRELGRGLVDTLSQTDSGWQVSGPDELQLLKDKNTLLARLYNNTAIGTVLSSLAGIAGWTASTTASGNISARFDGETV